MIYQKEIQKVKERLSDFQSATVDYIDRRFYEDGQNRMLVADEVGLGKTWIAKGVIAKAYERWANDMHHQKEYLNVYYICSNKQLAAQNLSKVNFTGNKNCIISQVDRITLLALKPTNDDVPLHIYSLTPDTSFTERSAMGIKGERAIIYAILEGVATIKRYKDELSELMMGPWKVESWESTKEWYPRGWIRDNVAERFVEFVRDYRVSENNSPECYRLFNLQTPMTLLELLQAILPTFSRNKATSGIYYETVGVLRKLMVDACLELLEADIYIMDEFQRYSQLIETRDQSEQSTIAQKVFGQTKAKVLMLSATPFKAFTNQYDENKGEQHYREFMRVLKFLYAGQDLDWERYEEARDRLYTLMLQLANTEDRSPLIEEIEGLKEYLQNFYSQVMVRTEKIIASKDPNAMIVDVNKDRLLPITKQEINDFIQLDRVFRTIYESKGEHAPSPIDYAKSAPYAMSYLRDYKVSEKAQNMDLSRLKNAFVNLTEVNKYVFPKDGHWPNEKLHLLMRGIKKEARMLWCPPALPYYPYPKGGVYYGEEEFTKTLIFSAWKLVPKMIATLVSYEAEKMSIGRLPNEEGVKYFVDKRVANQGDTARRPLRRLVFAKDEKNMTTLLLAYPSRTIANIADPLQFINKDFYFKQIMKPFIDDMQDRIMDFCTKNGSSEDREGTHISWSYPMVSDWEFDNSWLGMDLNKIGKDNKESRLTTDYIPRLRNIVQKKELPIFPQKPTSNEVLRQANIMVLLAFGSPSICAYRALKRYYSDEKEMLSAAFRIGLAFIDMFNKPESIAAVELQYQSKMEYWQKVLWYCVDGNLQAVLDEYVFLLRNDYDDIEGLTSALCRALTIRTTRMKVDDAASFCKNESEDEDVRHNMRSHFAAAFGVNAKSNQGSEVRATNIREAFNSPFRPFVLATTSIGQEGLDFHWFCRRIIHWNLPNNPIDFEQREGRINRYRGKVIRQRVAEKYGSCIEGLNNPWDSLFAYAKQDKLSAKFQCDIVPNWHFDSNGVSIERIVPLYQFSQDIQRYENMKHILGLYRLTFGQPRQEELAEALDCSLTSDEIDKLLIDLCPIRHKKTENR